MIEIVCVNGFTQFKNFWGKYSNNPVFTRYIDTTTVDLVLPIPELGVVLTHTIEKTDANYATNQSRFDALTITLAGATTDDHYIKIDGKEDLIFILRPISPSVNVRITQCLIQIRGADRDDDDGSVTPILVTMHRNVTLNSLPSLQTKGACEYAIGDLKKNVESSTELCQHYYSGNGGVEIPPHILEENEIFAITAKRISGKAYILCQVEWTEQ